MNKEKLKNIILCFLCFLVTGVIVITFLFALANVKPRKINTKEYKVSNVSIYIQEETNFFGKIKEKHTAYSFTYLDDNGNIQEVEDFQNREHGLTKVKIGEKNYYEVKDDGMDCYRTLYLTKKQYNTLKKGTSEDG